MEAEGLFKPLRIFMNFLDPSWNYQIEDMQMIDAWQNIFQEAVLTNMEALKSVYGNDIVKFGMFLERMHNKFKG